MHTPQTEESKKKISEANKGKLAGDKNPSKRFEVRRKISIAMQGKVPWNKGIPWSDEIKEKMRKAKTGCICLEETKELMRKSHKENPIIFTKEIRKKITKGLINAYKNGKVSMHGKHHSEEYREILGERLRSIRKQQIIPTKDTSIEIKIQNFLKQLGIDFLTHQYIKNIEHGYQCDILIPSMNLVIECDGNYWHKYPIGNDIDHIRTSELLQKGFKVLRLWEFEIKSMTIDKFKEKLYG